MTRVGAALVALIAVSYWANARWEAAHLDEMRGYYRSQYPALAEMFTNDKRYNDCVWGSANAIRARHLDWRRRLQDACRADQIASR